MSACCVLRDLGRSREWSLASRTRGAKTLAGDRIAWEIAFAGVLAHKAFFRGHHLPCFWIDDLVAISGLKTFTMTKGVGLRFIAHTSPRAAHIPAWDLGVVRPRPWGLIALLVFCTLCQTNQIAATVPLTHKVRCTHPRTTSPRRNTTQHNNKPHQPDAFIQMFDHETFLQSMCITHALSIQKDTRSLHIQTKHTPSTPSKKESAARNTTNNPQNPCLDAFPKRITQRNPSKRIFFRFACPARLKHFPPPKQTNPTNKSPRLSSSFQDERESMCMFLHTHTFFLCQHP